MIQLPYRPARFAELNPLPTGLREGDDVVVYGYPLNSVLSSGGNVTSGTLSALMGIGNNASQIQVTAPIQPGSSGSPVCDRYGRVIGVMVAKLDDAAMANATGSVGQSVNFAINQQTVEAFLDANDVPYRKGRLWPAFKKSNADIAAEARQWTMLVENWQ